MSKTEVLRGVIMWSGRKPAHYQKLKMRDSICGQEVCFISSYNKYKGQCSRNKSYPLFFVVNSTNVLCFIALLFHILHGHVGLKNRHPEYFNSQIFSAIKRLKKL